MKKTMSLLLALVMCVGLGIPAFAHPVEASDADAAAISEVSPQYLVYQKTLKEYIGSLTTVNVTFTISEKGGRPAIESLDSVYFDVMDTSSVYWRLDSYTYQLTSDECVLHLSRSEMLAGVPTGYSDKAVITFSIASDASSVRESGPVAISPISVYIDAANGVWMPAENIKEINQ